jgi:hypothetical protein
MATSVGIERRVETTARLTDLIEPAHRIAHDRPRSEVDDRRGAVARRPPVPVRLRVDQENLRSSWNATVAA